jgi:crotonobetainyl-CoA:carnitine CoA-transferase CaiB-like acyl-CoA transferase
MALNVPGPLAVARLAAEGARVDKIEPPAGDPLQQVCPSWYAELHDQVHVERVDLKSHAGRDRLRELLQGADVFISSQRPSALARLGVDESTLQVRWLNIVGDRTEPEVAGHDLTYQAKAGLLTGSMPVSLFADVMGSERAFAAVLLLLRQPTGARAEVGLYDSLLPLVAPLRHGVTAPGGLLGGGLPAYRIYHAREGVVAIAALEPAFRTRLYEGLQLPPDSPLDEAMLARTASEWEAWGRAHDVPIARVRSWDSDA